eukprot:TRINITY_DN72290_c0_g1_i1.p1 TRINITY_DN72290_c0_g1~~TRINITY_DN72290_c0_g1_i1.p1  ORF type:complete len:385 (+),score=74.21 TRINITY_DN72290_c0_g1_i1:120-1274(+)
MNLRGHVLLWGLACALVCSGRWLSCWIGTLGGRTRMPERLLRPSKAWQAAAGADVGPTGNSLTMPLYSFGLGSNGSSMFERIDDVVMGGISNSKLVDRPGYVSWTGLVRTAGGGFCGQRTRAFDKPVNLSGATGLYIRCRLASDDDAKLRVWKLSLRTDEGRGDVVYQAPFLPSTDVMETQFVPFSNFMLVQGPRALPNAPKISNASAIYQLGFTVSKFVLGEMPTVLNDFRNGTFEVDIEELGAYTSTGSLSGDVVMPGALSDKEVEEKRPLPLKILLPVLKRVFSEEKRRKSSAAKLLAERGVGRLQLARMGWQFKRGLRQQGLLRSLWQSSVAAVSATVGLVFLFIARCLVFPVLRRRSRKAQRKREEKWAEAAAKKGDSS